MGQMIRRFISKARRKKTEADIKTLYWGQAPTLIASTPFLAEMPLNTGEKIRGRSPEPPPLHPFNKELTEKGGPMGEVWGTVFFDYPCI